MKFTCVKSVLQSAVNTVSRAASSKSPIPALEGILLEAGPAGVKLTGYDLKKGIYTTVDAEVSQPGSIVISAKIFADIVRSLPEGVVSITAEGLNVSISCENSDFNIIGTDFKDYPELPSIDQHKGISLPQNILGEMIRQTIFAVSDNEARPVYTGEMFEIAEGCLTLVAVDGYRLALRREKIDKEMENYSFIVPGNALSDLEKLCGDNDEDVTIALGNKHISFTIGKTVIISRRLEGDFLNYRKTVPAAFNVKVRADRHMLQRTVERVSLIIDDKIKNPLRCTFGDGEIRIACSTSLGKAEDICIVEGEGKGVEIGFNNRYILDALKSAPAEEINVCLNTGSSPCIITPADESEKFLYMVLPVRLKAE